MPDRPVPPSTGQGGTAMFTKSRAPRVAHSALLAALLGGALLMGSAFPALAQELRPAAAGVSAVPVVPAPGAVQAEPDCPSTVAPADPAFAPWPGDAGFGWG